MTSYEEARERIESVPPAREPGARDVKWMTGAHVVGVARDPEGRVEVFLRGPQIRPSSSIVREAMEFRVVHRNGQPDFDANLLVLPALGHFDQVAALICTELLRGGADTSLKGAFLQTEPIIELAIERMHMSNQALLGMAGELLLLDSLCRCAQDAQVVDIIDGWDGWRRSSRDLTVGATGIEVKTTTGPASSHYVEGVHQVECDDGNSENRLVLVSIGLQVAVDGGNAFTIPQLVDSIIDCMSAAGLPDSAVEQFLWHLKEYGAASGGGYDHRTQAADRVYATAFVTSFFRAYDMADEAIEVLRRHDLIAHAHVEVNSVRFRINLPLTVGPGNPVVGANQVAKAILG